MESSRNMINFVRKAYYIIKGGQNGVKSQRSTSLSTVSLNYKGGAKWSQVATEQVIHEDYFTL